MAVWLSAAAVLMGAVGMDQIALDVTVNYPDPGTADPADANVTASGPVPLPFVRAVDPFSMSTAPPRCARAPCGPAGYRRGLVPVQ